MNNTQYLRQELNQPKGTIHGIAKELKVDAMELLTMTRDQLDEAIASQIKK